MLVCAHVITLSLQYKGILYLYRYFKQMPDPEGPLFEILPSASIKVVHAGHFKTTEGVTVQISALNSEYCGHAHNNLCKYLLRQTKATLKLFNNILINMIAMHRLFLFTTELIVSAIFDSNSNTRKPIKILRNLQSSKI